MTGVTDALRRRWLPSTVIAASAWHAPARGRAALARLLGRRPTMELYFAFDDPYAAVALPGLMRIAQRYRARLRLYPLIERGIENDPALEKRRAHAIADSMLLARRDGRVLRREQPFAPGALDELAAQAAALDDDVARLEFAARTLEGLWFGSAEAAPRGRVQPAADPALRARLAENTARLKRLGHWESPAARVEGAWFFAHERLPQIEAWLKELGWVSDRAPVMP